MDKTVDYELVGDNLYRIMKEKKITQTELGKRMCIYPSVVSTYVLGKSSPKVSRLQEIAVELGVDVRELLKPREEWEE